VEEYTPSEIAMIFFEEPLSNAFYMAFKIALPVALNVFTVPLPDDFSLEAHSMTHTAVSAMFGGIAYSATAGDQLSPVMACMVNPKSANLSYCRLVSSVSFRGNTGSCSQNRQAGTATLMCSLLECLENCLFGSPP
jgi:hypothetical protein